jgi:DNA primase
VRTPKDILEHFKIDFVENHSSVSKNCYGIDCPFCGDTNKHCGVFKEHGNFSCWKCGEKGTLYRLLKAIKYVSWSEYCKISGTAISGGTPKSKFDQIFKKEFKIPNDNSTSRIKQILKDETIRIVPEKLPMNIEKMINLFLIHRQYTYKDLMYYACRYGISGYFQGRLVIPVFDPFKLGNVLGFVGRDITKTANSKYLISEGFKKNQTLYFTRFDFDPENKYFLVEGIFDAWRIAQVSQNYVGVAMFGHFISTAQTNTLLQTCSNITYIPDGDVPRNEVQKVLDKLSMLNPKNIVLPMREDPDSYITKNFTV